MPLPVGILQPNGRNSLAAAKENDGRASRKRWLCRVTVWVGIVFVVYQLLWSYWLAGWNIPNVEIDKVTGQKRIRRRPERLFKRDVHTNQVVPTSPFDGIMEGHLSLMSIKIPRKGLVQEGDQKYSGVRATFCHIAWRLQDQDPSKVPMFQDLRDQSPLCLGTRYTVDLWEITRQAQTFDWRNHTFVATQPQPGQGPVQPTAVVFHQTRCGSTLIANVLATFMPQHTRVYSEAPAPLAALTACSPLLSQQPCDEGSQEALVQDVFYMMGRTPGPTLPQYVFYKIQSVGTHAMNVFTRAMPNVPWIFAYRDPVEIMMSHFKNYQTGNPLSAGFMPNCLRNYGKPKQLPIVKEMVQAAGRTVAGLTKEEYCAAHLASLGESAIREYEKRTGKDRWFVNYKELPFMIWEKVLPSMVPFVSHEQVQRMHQMGKVYSKGRGEKGGQHWQEDSTMKQGRAPESVKAAATLFMDPVYDKMEQYRTEMEGQN